MGYNKSVQTAFFRFLRRHPVWIATALVWGMTALFFFTRARSLWDGTLLSDVDATGAMQVISNYGQNPLPLNSQIITVNGTPPAKLVEMALWNPAQLPHLSPSAPDASPTLEYTLRNAGNSPARLIVQLVPTGWRLHWSYWGPYFYTLPGLLIISWIIAQRPKEPVPHVTFFALSCNLGYALLANSQLVIGQVLDTRLLWLRTVLILTFPLLYFSSLIHQGLIFPVRHKILARRPRLLWWVYLLPLAGFLLYASILRPFVSHTAWLIAWGGYYLFVQLLMLPLIGFAYLSNLWNVRDPIAYLQAKWVSWGACVAISAGLLVWLLFVLDLGRFGSVTRVTLLMQNLQWFFSLASILALVVAISEFGLYKITLFFNKTIVFLVLFFSMLPIYFAVHIFTESLMGSGVGEEFLAVTISLLVIIPTLQFLERRLTSVMLASPFDPQNLLVNFGAKLEKSFSPHEISTATIVEVIAKNLDLPYAEFTPHLSGVAPYRYGAPMPGQKSLEVPVQYYHQRIGSFHLQPRYKRFLQVELQLLNELARQTGIALYAQQQYTQSQRLAAQMQDSREKLVTAREDERRRLRRDLHDGLGPALATLSLKIETLQDDLPPEQNALHDRLQELRQDLQASLYEIRRLVQGLRPPVLDQLGLHGAIEFLLNSHRRQGLECSLRWQENLPAFSAAQEVAIFRIVSEALTNVVKHAFASTSTLTLEVVAERLELSITDNGRGYHPVNVQGVGILSMQERAAELGGDLQITNLAPQGTRVCASFPMR